MSGPDDPYGLEEAARLRDPYPAYARLIQAGRPVHSPFWGAWILARHTDVSAGFREPGFSANRAAGYTQVLPPAVREHLAPLLDNISSWALLSDPPAHTRLRGLVGQAFTPRLAEALTPRVQALVDRLLAAIGDRPGFDAIAELAAPLPVSVIGELLGLPREDDPLLKRWSDAIATFFGMPRLSMEVAESALRGVIEMEDYFRRVIDARRRAPGEDFVTMLVQAHDTGGRLSDRELLSSLCMVLFGGHETTTHLIGNGLWLLLRHPDQARYLARRPDAMESALEEVLRYEPPVQRMGRVARADVEIGGAKIPAGSRVFMVMAAANRDPAQFSEPHRFDVLRRDGRHIAFGLGPHYCLGASLGRMEATAAIAATLRRYPRLALSPEAIESPAWFDNLTVRGHERLPLLTGR